MFYLYIDHLTSLRHLLVDARHKKNLHGVALRFSTMLKQTSMQRIFGQAYAYPCPSIICSIVQVLVNQVAGTQVVDEVAGVQVVVDEVAGVQVVDQVTGVRVVLDQATGEQVLDQVTGVQMLDQVTGAQIYAGSRCGSSGSGESIGGNSGGGSSYESLGGGTLLARFALPMCFFSDVYAVYARS